MSRIIRAALATAASVAALAGSVTTAHADETTPRAAAAPSFVQLQAQHSGQCLTIANGSLRNGADAVQSKCADDLDNQLFDLAPTGSATFELQAKHSGKCLEVDNADTKAGTNTQQWWCVGKPQQRWKLVMVDVAKELYELRPMHAPERCLDISDASLKDGANAQQWYCNGTTAQRWRIQPAKA
ncbi:RICIN domain-containing protein [Streptomyces sp. NPDC026206]|uniref:RICIN domain-containing protein n=1 Tax=Streptomyces sp. NPDC026206 TaxID=3157089 RepID=UPI0033D6AC6D